MSAIEQVAAADFTWPATTADASVKPPADGAADGATGGAAEGATGAAGQEATDPGARARAIVEACHAHDGRSPLNEAAELTLRHDGLAHAELWLAEGGLALLTEAPGDEPGFELVLAVVPEVRRSGLAASLLERVLHVHPRDAMTAWSHGNHPAAAILTAQFGFARVRDLWVMRRPLPGDPLPHREPPEGVSIRTFEPGRDEDAVLAVNAAAFAGHPEQGRMTRADLDQRLEEPWFDPKGFFLAERGGALLGFHWTKVHPGDGADRSAYGEVYVVGVAPEAQGSGLGTVLTLAGLHHLAEQALDEVLLYVEGDNDAAKLVYERLGFTHDPRETDVMYQR